MKIIDADFTERRNFSFLLHQRKVWHAVEVGTDRGHFARQLLSTSSWTGMLWCIDPYLPYDGMNWNREADLAMAVAVLAPFVPRVRIVRATSEEWIRVAQEWLPHIGFVYIDGDHTREAVARDIATWWPILKPGGILAGHDFCPPYAGVQEAVTQFAEENDLTVRVVYDVDSHSWFVEKPAPPPPPELPPDELPPEGENQA